MNFSNIAIFILATTRIYYGISSYHRRMVPIFNSYGNLFPYLYFIIGNSTLDYRFLSQLKCNFKGSIYADSLELYVCSTRMKILRAKHCLSSYFGSGPTCRCQVALQYFLKSSQLLTPPYFCKYFFVYLKLSAIFLVYSL